MQERQTAEQFSSKPLVIDTIEGSNPLRIAISIQRSISSIERNKWYEKTCKRLWNDCFLFQINAILKNKNLFRPDKCQSNGNFTGYNFFYFPSTAKANQFSSFETIV